MCCFAGAYSLNHWTGNKKCSTILKLNAWDASGSHFAARAKTNLNEYLKCSWEPFCSQSPHILKMFLWEFPGSHLARNPTKMTKLHPGVLVWVIGQPDVHKTWERKCPEYWALFGNQNPTFHISSHLWSHFAARAKQHVQKNKLVGAPRNHFAGPKSCPKHIPGAWLKG